MNATVMLFLSGKCGCFGTDDYKFQRKQIINHIWRTGEPFPYVRKHGSPKPEENLSERYSGHGFDSRHFHHK